jgi:hypothetical protein
MAYDLYSQSFGSYNANKAVSITSVVTGQPALILSSPLGGIVSNNGLAKLDSNGDLSVCIDIAIVWNVVVLEQNFFNDSAVALIRRVKKSDLSKIVGDIGTIYVTDEIPLEYFYWDGAVMVQLPTSIQSTSVKSFSDQNMSGITYNLNGKVTSYVKEGTLHSVDYSVPGKITITNTSGASKTFLLDNQGRATSFY